MFTLFLEVHASLHQLPRADLALCALLHLFLGKELAGLSGFWVESYLLRWYPNWGLIFEVPIPHVQDVALLRSIAAAIWGCQTISNHWPKDQDRPDRERTAWGEKRVLVWKNHLFTIWFNHFGSKGSQQVNQKDLKTTWNPLFVG